MGLADLWKESPREIEGRNIAQIVGFAGKLADDNAASAEFCKFLTLVTPEILERFGKECFEAKFDDGGFALQDIVNEVGRRLGFDVRNGRYRGVRGEQGHDGLWIDPDGHALIVEVKTTDAYSIRLEPIMEYRRALVAGGTIQQDKSSVLLVVGRDDTGVLESQVRGSRHAWDIRLISVDALVRLMRIRFDVEDPRVHSQIQRMLIPAEYTKLDGIVKLVFDTLEEIVEEDEKLPRPPEKGPPRKNPKFKPVSFHEECAERLGVWLKIPLQRQSKAMFTSVDRQVITTCAVSRLHQVGKQDGYWFAFHPHQKAALEAAPKAYAAFGCGSADLIFAIPFVEFAKYLPLMFTTEVDGRTYWHVEIVSRDGGWVLRRRKDAPLVDVSRFKLPTTAKA